MTGGAVQRRPGVVTAAAILCWVVGALEAGTGLLYLRLASLNAMTDTPAGSAFTFGIGYIVVGLAYIAVGFGVFRGADLARVIVLLVSVINFAVGLFTALSGQPLTGILSMGLAVAITLPLWVGRGRAWFDGHRRAS